MSNDRRKMVSADLNESVDPNETNELDQFLDKEEEAKKSVLKKQSERMSSSRPKSIVKSLRESVGFINTNKFGEGRRIEEAGDTGDKHISIKDRQSQQIQKLGTVAAAASIFKAFVGLGVLFLSNQFWETGIIAMPTIMIGSLILTLYCTKLLLECAENHGDSYSEIAESAYGPKMKKLAEILIICSQMAFCTNYVYFISSQMGSVIYCATETDQVKLETCNVAEDVYNNVQLWYFLPILMVIYVPLVWIRSMEKLAFTHLLGDIIILTVVTAIFVYAGMEMGDNHGVQVNDYFTKEFYKAVPYSAFAFEGVAVVLPLREIVEDKQGFFKLTCIVVGGICIFYIIFAEFCNLAWGSMEEYILITDALPATDPVTYTLKALYTVNLFFSYPLMMSPAINLIESYVFNAGSVPTTKRYWMQNLLRSGLVAFTIVLALVIYNYISLFIEVIAASTCSPLAFTLPALFHYKLVNKSPCQLIIVIGTCILTVFMVVQSIYALVKDLTSDEE